MTISTQTRTAGPFTTNGSTTAFPFAFKCFAASDIVVVRRVTATGVESNLVLNTDYTVSLNANQDANPGGTVNTVSALGAGFTLTLTTNLQYLQPTDLTNQGGFYPKVITTALDRLTIFSQQVFGLANRALKFPISDGNLDATVPGKDQRKGRLLAFHETTGLPIAGPTIADTGTVGDSIAAIVTVANNIADVNTVADYADEVANFNATYQGPKATDPTLRNDGTALQQGDLYFNTNSKRLRVYTGVRWSEANTGSVSVQRFTGDGTTVSFQLNTSPDNENVVQVFIGGIYQSKTVYDLTGTNSDILTFVSAPPAGAAIEAVTFSVLPLGVVDASQVQMPGGGTLDELGTPGSTVSVGGVDAGYLADSATRRAINAQAFGLKPNDTSFNNWTKAKELFDYCRANKFDIYIPAGRWTVLELNWPFLNDQFPIASMLDCYNITVFGDGPTTILETRSTNGADVLNLRALKNFHIRNLSVSATLLSPSAAAGSNGVSIVYGWDNVTVIDVWAENLPYKEKPAFLDGGKAFTIQPGTSNLQICGSLKARIFAKGCVHAVGYEIDLPSFVNQKPAIDVEFTAEDCYESVVISAGAPATPISESLTTGFTCRGFSINSQKDLIAGRAHGANIDIQIVTTKTLAARKLNPSGSQWKAGDDEVTAAYILAAKNSNFWLKGDKRECTTKITVGAANAGAAGYTADTKNCTLDVDVAGAGTVSDFTIEVFSGQSVSTCELVVSKKTIDVPPLELYKGANQNAVWSGTDLQLQLLKTRNLSFVGNTNPDFTYATLGLTDDTLTSRQYAASSSSAAIHVFKDHNGVSKFAIRNDGTFNTGAKVTATSVTTVTAVLAVYDMSGTRIGYVPFYNSFS